MSVSQTPKNLNPSDFSLAHAFFGMYCKNHPGAIRRYILDEFLGPSGGYIEINNIGFLKQAISLRLSSHTVNY